MKIPVLRSLNTKLLVIVVCFVAASGLLSAWYQASNEERLLLDNRNDGLRRLATRYSDGLAADLSARRRILESVAGVVERNLRQPYAGELNRESYQRSPDGAVHLMQGQSGVFVPSFADLSDENLRWLATTEGLWEFLAPPMSSLFDAFYIISDEGISRAYPKLIAMTHKPDHDVTEEVFFDLAAPANNASRQPRWTPAYYDAYLRQWMISLVIPLYIDDEFFGVLGGDVNLSYFFEKLQDVNSLAETAGAFVFDSDGNMILIKSQRDELANLDVDSYQKINLKDDDSGVKAFIDAVNSGGYGAHQLVQTTLYGRQSVATYRPIEGVDWGVVIYYPLDAVAKQVAPIRTSIYRGTLWLALLLSVVLYISLHYLVTNRIGRLVRVAAQVGEGNWQVKIPTSGRDEISALGIRISDMLRKINDLIAGLNANIEDLEQANLQSRKLTAAIENSSNLVVILNAEGELEYANQAYWEVSGFAAEQLPKPARAQALLLPADTPEDDFWQGVNQTLFAGEEWRGEYAAELPAGRELWLMLSISAIRDSAGAIQYYTCSGRDISDLKHNREQMEKLAYYDQLTGLQNRVLFKSQLHMALKSCERDGSQMALMYLDLDHFKRINDTFGHEAGDQMLVEVAARLKRCLREEDAVARLGGDEFAVLLNRIGTAQYASIVANKIITSLNRPLLLQGQELIPGTSIGITLAPHDSTDLDMLMKNADLAMYQAKEKGRNSFQFYTADMNREVERRLRLEREMRVALEQGQFELYYQPQIDLRTGEITGAEALIRWNHPERGMVSPLEFIPLAEETGLIVPIGKWALRSACQQAKSIHKGVSRRVKISVNISSRQLREERFVDELEAVFEEARIDPSLMELEVTESVLMDNIQSAIEILQRARSLGVGVAIDDFGTGYSSLSYLKRLPVTTLKVDREFVKDLPEDMEDRAITSLIVTMAGSLNHEVVVEGVETVEQLSFLKDAGCDYAQGFYYSRPITSDALMVMLFEWDAQKALDWSDMGSFGKSE